MNRNVTKEIGFEDSKFIILYIQELYFLCDMIAKKADALFLEFPATSDKVYISAKVDGLDLIYSILSYASKSQELITCYDKGIFHRSRALFIRNLLGNLNLSELCSKKVRNTIEHFSEYLDKANKEHSLFESTQRYFVAFNLIFSHWTPIISDKFPFKLYKTPQLDLPLYPVRIYIASERKFYNMNWSIDLDALYKEALLVKKHLFAQDLFGEETAPEQWVSELLVC